MILWSGLCFFFFFFQAEDGIRDDLVTGVQTCALPIYACMYCASTFASVVFPQPGGPQRIMEETTPFSIMRRIGFPLPTRCSCPINSSIVFGRSFSAKGVCMKPIVARSRHS